MSMRSRGLFLLPCLLVLLCQAYEDPSTFRLSTANQDLFAQRIVAVGDLHGDYAATLNILKLAKVVDNNGNWMKEPGLILVQTGDVVDRGPDTLKLYQYLFELTEQAKASGGRVIQLLGNHEVMNFIGDWRYVNRLDVKSFGGIESRTTAWSVEGELGSRLRSLNVTALVGDTLFVHAGINVAWATRFKHTDAINQYIREALASVEKTAEDPIFGDGGPLWYRDYVLLPESQICSQLSHALNLLGAKRMVVGHTVQSNGRILSKCSNQLFGIDVGISKVYGGQVAALELIQDIEAQKVTKINAIYPHRVELLFDSTV
eukprot:GILJ01002362.1.p1 GENE.GILJ01002362.1~~GILJ01002362.1.p1  ORF type:complete len:332 (-),score=36.27 GILJ01002362.1:133-1083(-)